MVVLILSDSEAYVFTHWGYEWWFVGFDLVYTWDWWGWIQ